MENPPTKRADADPEIWLVPRMETVTETDMPCPMTFNLGAECARCSGEYGKKRQYQLPVSRSFHGFAYLQSTRMKTMYKD